MALAHTMQAWIRDFRFSPLHSAAAPKTNVSRSALVCRGPSARWRSPSASFPKSSSPASADILLGKGISASSGSFIMGAKFNVKELKIRKDRTPAVLRKVAKDATDPRVPRRILAIANALSGINRAEAASSAGMDRQTLRDWVIRYNAHGVAGLVDRWAGGRPPILDERQEVELLEIVLKGPDPVKDGFCAVGVDGGGALDDERRRQLKGWWWRGCIPFVPHRPNDRHVLGQPALAPSCGGRW
jgi:Winged helix-turn helix